MASASITASHNKSNWTIYGTANVSGASGGAARYSVDIFLNDDKKIADQTISDTGNDSISYQFDLEQAGDYTVSCAFYWIGSGGDYNLYASASKTITIKVPNFYLEEAYYDKNSEEIYVSAYSQTKGHVDFELWKSSSYIETITRNISAEGSATGSFSSLEEGKIYKVKAVLWSDGDAYITEDQSDDILVQNRPPEFAWSSGHEPNVGIEFNLLASDWKALQTNINDVRIYKGGSSYSFTKIPSEGTSFLAEHYNEASRAIRRINPIGSYGNYIGGRRKDWEGAITKSNQISYSDDPEVNTHEFKSGDIISADALNMLVTELNNVE